MTLEAVLGKARGLVPREGWLTLRRYLREKAMGVDFDGIVPFFPGKSCIERQHIMRYRFAARYIQATSRLLDVACGGGYGSHFLAGMAQAGTVFALDHCPRALAYAQAHYYRPNIKFCLGNALALPFPTGFFDMVVSFETIEHLPDGRRFLAEVRRVLKPGGFFVCSTPNAAHSFHQDYHLKEYYPEEFFALVEEAFPWVERYCQTLDGFRRYRELLWRGYCLARNVAGQTVLGKGEPTPYYIRGTEHYPEEEVRPAAAVTPQETSIMIAVASTLPF